MQTPPPVSQLLAQLAEFAIKVKSALSRPDIDWQCAPAGGEWCLTEVACHLRDVEHEVHQPRFQALIAANNAFIPGAVADEWVTERHYRHQSGPAALTDFLNSRQETLNLLTNLPDPIWQRSGQHTFFGPTTIHELLSLAVKHDQAHWEQILTLLTL